MNEKPLSSEKQPPTSSSATARSKGYSKDPRVQHAFRRLVNWAKWRKRLEELAQESLTEEPEFVDELVPERPSVTKTSRVSQLDSSGDA
jgi:hypothetical protein